MGIRWVLAVLGIRPVADVGLDKTHAFATGQYWAACCWDRSHRATAREALAHGRMEVGGVIRMRRNPADTFRSIVLAIQASALVAHLPSHTHELRRQRYYPLGRSVIG